jgi:8-oxo-dGTP pyrophosphatase MutT (NUDIX family)
MPKQTWAVSKALLVADDKILILRRSDSDIRRPLQWDLPGGAIDPHEDAKQACSREVMEETGLTVAIGSFKTLHAMTELTEDGRSVSWMFFRALVDSTDVNLSSEHDQSQWVTLAEAIELFKYPRHLKVLRYIQTNDLLRAETSD